MVFRPFILLFACTIMLSPVVFAQRAHTPARGSAEREAIMDALRVPAKRDLGRTVIFQVDLLRVADDWAFARVSPILPDGGGD